MELRFYSTKDFGSKVHDSLVSLPCACRGVDLFYSDYGTHPYYPIAVLAADNICWYYQASLHCAIVK